MVTNKETEKRSQKHFNKAINTYLLSFIIIFDFHSIKLLNNKRVGK